MNYKLLALDIDGTILNSNSELTPRTKDSLLQAKKQGLEIVLATGRRLTNTLPVADALGLTEFLVVHNGAVVYHQPSDQILWQDGIELALAQEILDKLEAQAMNYIVYTGQSGGEQVLAPLGRWQEPENLLTYYLGEDAEFRAELLIQSPPVRISIIDHRHKVAPFYQELLHDYAGVLNALYFGTERETWRGIEIIPASSHKATGVLYVADRLGIRSEEIVAIGDNVNDLEMIAAVGLGIAMENGPPLLKTKAKRIAPSNDEDGVAVILSEILL